MYQLPKRKKPKHCCGKDVYTIFWCVNLTVLKKGEHRYFEV